MSDEQIRVAIAEYCGVPVNLSEDGEIIPEDAPPDYLNDLNAMHAVEAELLGHEMIRYQAELSGITVKNPHVASWDLIHATARQRAEAFLKTVGEWKEDA